MSFLARWTEVNERATGKWQIPALLLAIIAMGISVITYRSPIDKIPFDELAAGLPGLIDRGLYTAAIGNAERMLLVPGKSAVDVVPVHVGLARSRMLRAARSGAQVASIGRAVIEHYERAADGGFELTGLDQELVGRAFDWSGDFRSAVAHYDAALAMTQQKDLELRRHTAELRADQVGAPPAAQHRELDGLIADAAEHPAVLKWSVQRKVDLLCDEQRADEALDLLARAGVHVNEGRWGQWFEYLRAYALFRSGSFDEVETRLRLLRSQLSVRDDLYAQTTWLLGRAVLGGAGPERPAEAITFFQDVVAMEAAPVFAAASEIGLAEALVLLERFDEALERYEIACKRMRRLPPSRHLNLRVIESSLTVVSERLRREGRIEAALRFARRAVEADANAGSERRSILLERLSNLLAALGRKMRAEADRLAAELAVTARQHPESGPATIVARNERELESTGGQKRLRDQARRLLLEAGATDNRIADLETLHEGRAAAASWRGAERINESGDLPAIIEVMERFLHQRPQSTYTPRVLRYLGQAQQSLGLLDDAVETYRQNLQRFPRTPDAGSSLIPLARCYIAMGKKHADLAEKTLRLVLDDSEVFTPEAPEYADALYLLGDLLNRVGAYERAIPWLEEAMGRYPADPRTARARFLLGDCYRQSGLAMRKDYEDASFGAQRQRILADLEGRLEKAVEYFAQTVSDFESRPPNELAARDRVYLRHARLYRADCHFELGEYAEALAHYERAAWIYKGTTTALGAYVQIINCHVFMGSGADADAALRRALYLVDTMSDQTFADGVGLETRDDWRDYFKWVQNSKLF